MCVRVYLCVAGWLRFLHMLVCSLLLEVMPGIPSCRSMAGLFRRWSDGHMVTWPHGRPFRCSDGRREERTAHCWHFEALLVRGIFASHISLNLHAPSSKGVFAPVCAAITVNSQPTLYQC